jgi:transposase
MPDRRRKFDRDFQHGAVQLVTETGKPIAQVARELGISEGTLGTWVARPGSVEPETVPVNR